MIFDELDVVFCGDLERPCTTQDVAELKYLECCIKEAMRIYPSIPFVMRNLTEDVEIGTVRQQNSSQSKQNKYLLDIKPTDGHTLPAGVTVAMVFYAIHHNPVIYPDPEVFKPERFFPENSVGRHPYAFIPFSAGPRNCIGESL